MRIVRKETANYDPWWGYDDIGDAAESCGSVFSAYRRINTLEGYRQASNRAFCRWYGDTRYNGFSMVGIEYPSPNTFDDQASTENVIREILVTNWNRFKKNKPQPTVVTTGSLYSGWDDAENQETWIRGIFAKDKAYQKLDQAQFHSMVFGDGFLGVRDDWERGRPVVYHIPNYEIHVDPVDGCDGEPRTIYRIGSLPKEFLAARFPQYKDEIWKASPFFEELWNIRPWQADSLSVNFLEAWHLPSSPLAKDGRHIFAMPTLTIANEPWEDDYFPIVKVPWNPRPFGYFSAGLIEDLIAPQRMRNKVSNAIDEHLRLLSGSFWSLKRGSNIVKAAISNLIGRAIEYTGDKAPTLNTPEPVSPNLFERENQKREQMFAQSGTSNMAAQALKPAGLNSGKALRVYADQEDQRLVGAHIIREDAVVELAQLLRHRAQTMLETADDKLKDKVSLDINVVRGGRVVRIGWESTDLDESEVQVLPASSLSTTLAGKLEDIADLSDEGIITSPAQKRQLLQMPDLQSDNDLELAVRNMVMKRLGEILKGKQGDDCLPDPSWDLQTCMDLGLKFYAMAQLRDYPEERQQLLRNWNTECVARLQKQAPPTPPAAPAAGGPPGLPGPSGMPLPAGPIAGAPVPAGPPAGPPTPVGLTPGAQP